MNKNTMLIFLLFNITQIGFSSYFEIDYFGDIDNPLPKLAVIKGNGYRSNLDFERRKGFKLTILIQEIEYNKIMDNIIRFSYEPLILSKNYFICKTANETYYFLDFEKMLKILEFAIAIIEDQDVVNHLTDYIRRIEILSTHASTLFRFPIKSQSPSRFQPTFFSFFR